MNSIEWLFSHFKKPIDKKIENVYELPINKPQNDISLWYSIAKKYSGQKEDTGHNDGKFVADCFAAVGSSIKADKWCAAFVGRCLKEAGYLYVKKGVAAMSYAKYGSRCDMMPGAIIVLEHPNGSHHVTFYDHKVDEHTIACLGGNQRNRVGVDNYDLRKEKILAVRWPVK